MYTGFDKPPLSREQVLRKIKDAFSQNKVVPTIHFKEKQEKRDITIKEVWYVLEHGIINVEPKIDNLTDVWKYRVKGQTIDDRELVVVIALEDDVCILVTVWEAA